MDEVDIDNVEDLNELESRLYAQIHHEATDEPNIQVEQLLETCDGQGISNDDGPGQTSNTNRTLSRRYWANSEYAGKQWQQNQTPQVFIRNPFKTSNKTRIQQKQSTQNENSSALNCLQETENTKESQNNKNNADTAKDLSTTLLPEAEPETDALLTSLSNENKKSKTAKTDHLLAKNTLPTKKSNLKLNPVANWIQRKKNNINKKANSNRNSANTKKSAINIKQSLFARQEQKLQKAKRIEEKRQKSKKAKNSTAEIATKSKSVEIINLDSDITSDCSDIIIIPTAPPPIFTVDDSGDEGNESKVSITMEHEENALDSTDVEMLASAASFIKPQNIFGENRLENLSRCTSPCSIQSSDDFIGQIDHVRVLSGARGMADDEDLLVLTSDLSSLLEVSGISKQCKEVNSVERANKSVGCSVKPIQEGTTEANDEFVTPKTTDQQSQSRDYRVDQGQYSRAVDVYESESDITDSIYSKGANKATVIRQIDTSSDEFEDIGNCNQRTKRLRKRRASSSNKESDHNNENIATSSENEEYDDDNKVLRTTIPFIAKGIAVESYKSRIGCRTLSSCSPTTHKRKTINIKATAGHMSDTEFIETLNNLAQGQEGEKESQTVEEDEESETENIPTARDIAEKILAQHNAKENTNKISSDDVALPKDIINELDKVFETIDQLDQQDANQSFIDNNTVRISDSSDSDSGKLFTYKSLPDVKSHVIEYSPDALKKHKTLANTRAENGSPIYNITYIRGPRKPGGIGWNDEMRKFYNESWNGEYFFLVKVRQKMNPDKSLWKISTEDRFNTKLDKRSRMKCTNCCAFGHMRNKCKRAQKPLICYMCGDSGHREPRCPNTICLRCGNKTQVFTKSCNVCSYQNRLTCPICKIGGHSLDYCPDKWRRYHSTTEANSHPVSNIDYNPRKYCCICGACGHISDNCRSALRFLEYPAISSSIKSHEKSYSDVVVKAPHSGIAMNLMYKPCQEYKFDFVKQTSSNKYYGRFLKSVGMDYLFKRKRHMDSGTMELTDTMAKKAKRLSKKYEANPYLKVATANQNSLEAIENAPNQVQEITESGDTDQQHGEQQHLEDNVINMEDYEVEVISSKVEKDDDVQNDIQLNTINEIANTAGRHHKDFKSPSNVTSSEFDRPPTPPPPRFQMESALILDSDSNYSFSEHFDVASNSKIAPTTPEATTLVRKLNCQSENNDHLKTTSSKPNSREMETLPDFIPLINSTDDHNEQHDDNENSVVGISRRFIAAVSDDDDEIEDNRRNLSPLQALPCEAKIYLTQFHTNYLLSPVGNAFLKKTSQTCKLRARLDFTSVGHVLVIFGLPTNQDKFQRQLLLKFRDLEDERNNKQVHNNLNVPKRTLVLIRYLRESITQLMKNLGNVNCLFQSLQHFERQNSKSGYKSADKVRRLLNMILVGQAGLQDGTMHLDKLLISLKTLLNEVKSDSVPKELRSHITDHYKVIFSAYRHGNYEKLVDSYYELVSKNRMPQLNIDPVLLGQNVLNTSLSEEQKQKLELEQATKPVATSLADINTEFNKGNLPNALNEKTAKSLNHNQNTDSANKSFSSSATTVATSNKAKVTTPTNVSQIATATAQEDNTNCSSNINAKSSSRSSSPSVNASKTTANTSTHVKTKASTSATNLTSGSTMSGANESSKKQPQATMTAPSEKLSSVSTTVQEVSDKWKSCYDNLLTQISSENVLCIQAGDKARDYKLPSKFWSRESMRFLDDCLHLAAGIPLIVEKVKRVQNKSKNGQLSYNDFLAVLKLYTTLKRQDKLAIDTL